MLRIKGELVFPLRLDEGEASSERPDYVLPLCQKNLGLLKQRKNQSLKLESFEGVLDVEGREAI